MIYGHGDDIHQSEFEIKANFSSNVYYGGPHPQLLRYLSDNIRNISNYPEPNADSYRKELGQFHGIGDQQFLVTNGTAEAIYLICQAFHGTSATIFTPTFAEYEDAACLHKISCHFEDFRSIGKTTNIHTRIAFICNPNNPTGELLRKTVVEKLIANNQDTVFILDEAYAGFIQDPESAINFIQNHPNLIVMKSLTKLFCIPGIRIGYIAASEELIRTITTYKIPWSVNSMALAAGRMILQRYDDLVPDIKSLLKETQELVSQINNQTDFQACSTQTNFFLIKIDKPESVQLKHFLLKEYGCLVRDASNFRGLDGHFIRIATQKKEHNELLIRALKAWKQT